LEADADALGWKMIRFERECGIACHTQVAWLVMALSVDHWHSEHKEKT
jgi:hypothetical protein